MIPYKKLSKKAKKEVDRKMRGTWGSLSPVTRKPKNSRAYDRERVKRNVRKDAD